MHESSVAKEIMDIVTEAACQNEISKVHKIIIEVGEFSCIQQQMLTFAFQMIAEGTMMEDASLEYETVKAMARCESCDEEFPITFTEKTCPKCGQVSNQIIAGLEANVKEIEGE